MIWWDMWIWLDGVDKSGYLLALKFEIVILIMSEHPIILSLEGNIGAGKSTFLGILNES